MAGAAFLERLTAMTPAQRDQEHIPAILWSDPRVPNRGSAMLAGGEDPLPWLLNGIRGLERCGAKAIAIPCNTAHLWYDAMAAATPLPILHIVDATLAELRSRPLSSRRIGVMASEPTLKMALYQRALEAAGFEPLIPSEDEMNSLSTCAIRLVKANRTPESFAPAAECVRRLAARGAAAVLLACTELPLAIPHARRAEFGVELTDSIDGLAAAAIRWYRGE